MSCMGCRKQPRQLNSDDNNPTSEDDIEQKPLTYNECMKISNSLMVTLRRPEDRQYLEDILTNVQRLGSSANPEIKKYTTEFMTFFVKLLHKHCATQPLEIYDQWYGQGGKSSLQKGSRTQMWLKENQSYFFMEKTVDGGIIFYAAIAYDPSTGWNKGGLSRLCKQ